MRRHKGTVLLIVMLWFAAAAVVSAEPVTIELWGWTPGSVTGDKLAELIEDFNASQDEVRVVLAGETGIDKLIVAYAGGAAPDVTFNVADMAALLGGPNGILLPLDEFIDGQNGVPREAFIPDMWSFSTVDGKVYQMAVEGNERGLFVNTALASQVGLDVNQHRPIRDWNDLLDWAKKLTLRTGDEVTQWGFNANHNLGGDKWHWVWLNDGKLVALDYSESLVTHPNTIEALQFAADMIHVHGVAPPDHSGGVQNPFIQNRYAMVMERSTFIANLERQGMTDFITLPGPVGVGKEGGRFSGASASAIAIVNSTKHPEAAWKFVRYITYERGLEFAETRGGIPFLFEGLQNEKFRTQPWEAFADQIVNLRPERLPAGLPNDVFSNPFTQAWNRVIRGEVPASIAMQELHEVVSARLAEFRQSQ